jgi:hypothetical protein
LPSDENLSAQRQRSRDFAVCEEALLKEISAVRAEAKEREGILRSQVEAAQLELLQNEATSSKALSALKREKNMIAQQLAGLQEDLRLATQETVKLASSAQDKELAILKRRVAEMSESIGHATQEQLADPVFGPMFRESTKVQLVELLLDCSGELDEANRMVAKLHKKAEDNKSLRELVRLSQAREEQAAAELESMSNQAQDFKAAAEVGPSSILVSIAVANDSLVLQESRASAEKAAKEVDSMREPMNALIAKMQGDLALRNERLRAKDAEIGNLTGQLSNVARLSAELRAKDETIAGSKRRVRQLEAAGQTLVSKINKLQLQEESQVHVIVGEVEAVFYPGQQESRVAALASAIHKKFAEEDGDGGAALDSLALGNDTKITQEELSTSEDEGEDYDDDDFEEVADDCGALRTIREEEESEESDRDSGCESESEKFTEGSSAPLRVDAAVVLGDPTATRSSPTVASSAALKRHIRAPSNVPLNPTSFSPRSKPADHGMQDGATLLLLETANGHIRCGVVDMHGDGAFYDEFPSCLARPRKGGGDTFELVHMASGMSAGMYARFRSEGVFVGGDAWFCCMDHPDAGLRAKLDLSWPVERGHLVQGAMEDLSRLWSHAFAQMKLDSEVTPVILTYKPDLLPDEVCDMAEEMMEQFSVPALRMVNEATVIAIAAQMSTGIVISIGQGTMYASPIFEGCCLTGSVQTAGVGGGDLDRYMDYMLLSRTTEGYNQMVERRRLNYARVIKEDQCYVAKDFDQEARRAGHFKRKSMKVFEGASINPKLAKYGSYSEDDDNDEPNEVVLQQKSGQEVVMMVGRERFHTPEILFQPEVWEESTHSRGLVSLIAKAIMSCDTEIRPDLVHNIVLTGNCAKIPGLLPRLERELLLALPDHLSNLVRLRKLDSAAPGQAGSGCSPSAILKGAEMLYRREVNSFGSWVLHAAYEDDPSLIRRSYYFGAD